MERALISPDPAVMMGKPVVAGARIAVELILERPAAFPLPFLQLWTSQAEADGNPVRAALPPAVQMTSRARKGAYERVNTIVT